MCTKANRTSQRDLQQTWFENMMQEIKSQMSKFKTDMQDMKNPKIEERDNKNTVCTPEWPRDPDWDYQGYNIKQLVQHIGQWLVLGLHPASTWVFWSTTKSSTCSSHLVPRLLTGKKSSKHHNCRGRRGETKRQIQMMVSPKKIWYLTYLPGNSQTFKSVKVLSKRTFLCSTPITDSFALQMETFRFFRNTKLRAFFMLQNIKKMYVLPMRIS